MSSAADLEARLLARWRGVVQSIDRSGNDTVELVVPAADAPGVVRWLTEDDEYRIAAMTVRDEKKLFRIHYHFVGREEQEPWVIITATVPSDDPVVPSLSDRIHAIDWLEREAEDHYGIRFEGHPRLGDFVLHDEEWQEGLAPMRKAFDGRRREIERHPNADWRPTRLLRTEGAFSMTVGPIHGGIAEPVHFLLESVGEEVMRVSPRLFYKYRAIEKLAEGKDLNSALLLAERFDALHAFSHALAYCRAVERLSGQEVPQRAQRLRVLLAELERLRSHIGTIRGICGSTGLSVAESHSAILEEETLRLCGALTGHRYLFGAAAVGGSSLDVPAAACRGASDRLFETKKALTTLRDMLVGSSSFLDRLEEVGVVSQRQAVDYGLVGPVARASGYRDDLRLSHPYEGYGDFEFEQATEREGDGYARLRVLFFEAFQSIEICAQAAGQLEGSGDDERIQGETGRRGRGAGFAWVEGPGGIAFHAVWTDEAGRIDRYRIVPPSFFNWHGFHLATEGYAFQDFPIILATFGLSVSENDR